MLIMPHVRRAWISTASDYSSAFRCHTSMVQDFVSPSSRCITLAIPYTLRSAVSLILFLYDAGHGWMEPICRVICSTADMFTCPQLRLLTYRLGPGRTVCMLRVWITFGLQWLRHLIGTFQPVEGCQAECIMIVAYLIGPGEAM